MTPKQRVHKILKRCRWTKGGNVWAGYLPPSDIITLIEAGYRSTYDGGRDLANAKRDKKAGIGKPTWFYFVRNRKRGEWI